MARESGSDQERLMKNKDGSYKVIQALGAASAAIDSAFNLPFAGHIGAEKRRNTKPTMESLLENQVEGTDVMENFGMEPGAGATYVAGQAWDIFNPAKILAAGMRAPLQVTNVLSDLGEKLYKSATKDRLAKNIAEEHIPKLEKLMKVVTDTKVPQPRKIKAVEKVIGPKMVPLYKAIKKPEQGLEVIRGKKSLVSVGRGKNVRDEIVYDTENSLLGKKGKELSDVVAEASPKAKPINRADIEREMIASAKAKNASDLSGGKVNVDKLKTTINDTLTPYKTQTKVIPPRFIPEPKVMSKVDDSKIKEEVELFDSLVGDIKAKKQAGMKDQAEIGKMKRSVESENDKILNEKAKAADLEFESRAALKRNSSKEVAEEMKNRQTLLSNQEKLSAADKSKAESMVKQVEKENAPILAKIQELEQKIAIKKARVKPMDEIPLPKAQKGQPQIPAKEVLDIKLHNEKAAAANKLYLEKNKLPPVKDLEAQIAAYKAKIKQADVEIPPKVTEDMLPPIKSGQWAQIPNKVETDKVLAKSGVEAEIPPELPNMDAMGIEEAIATLANKRASKEVIEDSNIKIARENAAKQRDFAKKQANNGPVELDQKIDNISSVDDLWELKKNITKNRIKESEWHKLPVEQVAEQKALIEIVRKIDDKIEESLGRVNLTDGLASDKYLKANDEYSSLKILEDALETENISKIRSSGSPGVAGKATGETLKATSGGPMGYRAGAMASSIGTRTKQAVGSMLDDPTKLTPQALTELPTEAFEIPFDAPYINGRPTNEGEADMFNPDNFENLPDGAIIEGEAEAPKDNSRSPSSVVEIPNTQDATDIMAPESELESKMMETLAPKKPLWNPYVNEQILNTIIPRDSDRILSNPQALIAKLQQVAPDQVVALKDVLQNDPELIREAAPKIAMMFPQMFERDKYGMFDGKIIDPMMQQKFLADLSNDEAMSSIEKAKLAMKLQRGQSIYE